MTFGVEDEGGGEVPGGGVCEGAVGELGDGDAV